MHKDDKSRVQRKYLPCGHARQVSDEDLKGTMKRRNKITSKLTSDHILIKNV